MANHNIVRSDLVNLVTTLATVAGREVDCQNMSNRALFETAQILSEDLGMEMSSLKEQVKDLSSKVDECSNLLQEMREEMSQLRFGDTVKTEAKKQEESEEAIVAPRVREFLERIGFEGLPQGADHLEVRRLDDGNRWQVAFNVEFYRGHRWARNVMRDLSNQARRSGGWTQLKKSENGRGYLQVVFK
jgi:regulator of replication initiation timing